MTPANTARAYVMQWLKHYINLGAYELRPTETSAGQDMLDRLLAAVPYPRAEFYRENPMFPPWKRTPWVGTRHRMDVLFGMTFKLDAISDAVLDAIDDFFGPISLTSVAQVIHFARDHLVTDCRGDASMSVPSSVAHGLDRPTLCLHSTENGLASIETRPRLAALLLAAGVPPDSIDRLRLHHRISR
jgi:hypothetical protein